MEKKNALKGYTLEDIAALEDWFADKKLEGSLQLDNAVYIPDLKQTVTNLIIQAKVSYENPKIHGCIRLLEQIKTKIG